MLNQCTLSHKYTQYSALQMERKQSEFFPLFATQSLPTSTKLRISEKGGQCYMRTLNFMEIKHLNSLKGSAPISSLYTYTRISTILDICVHLNSSEVLNIDHI